MLISLFWPKEIRDLIKKYEEKGTLNPKAIVYLTRQTNVRLTIAFVIGGIVLYEQSVFFPLFLFLAYLAIWLDLKLCFHRNIAAYTNSKKRSVKVVSAVQSLYPMQWIRYEDIDGCGKIVIGGKPMIPEEELPKRNDEIFIYQDIYKKHLAMPDVDYIKQAYSLTTEVL